MSQENLEKFKEILLKSDFDETDFSIDFLVSHAYKNERQAMIHCENRALAMRAAAVEIQRWWRGLQTRRSVTNLVRPSASSMAVYSASKTAQERDEDITSPLNYGKSKLKQEYEYYEEHMKEDPNVDPEDIMTFEAYSVNIISDWWKRMARRRDVHGRPRPRLNRKAAAVKIQKAWRRHIDIQVYRYYRDLINFKARGDPAAMLRCINPNEAKLLDAAAGIHIRFRLAGEKFPPNIYYKIFTHRPVQDMCANSPKNYAVSKLTVCIDTNNSFRDGMSDLPTERQGWYKRVDHNGWRLVSDRLIQHIMADPVTWETSQKKYEFHHNKLQRKQDVEKRRKQRKIEWMKRMYRDGMLRAKADDQETVKLIEGAAAGMVATVEAAGPEALEEWEVDELLDWTTSLNFDDYMSGWKDLATSGHSEKKIDDFVRVYASQADPYEFTLSTGPSRYNSTRQSHNTPVSSGSAKFPVNSRYLASLQVCPPQPPSASPPSQPPSASTAPPKEAGAHFPKSNAGKRLSKSNAGTHLSKPSAGSRLPKSSPGSRHPKSNAGASLFKSNAGSACSCPEETHSLSISIGSPSSAFQLNVGPTSTTTTGSSPPHLPNFTPNTTAASSPTPQ